MEGESCGTRQKKNKEDGKGRALAPAAWLSPHKIIDVPLMAIDLPRRGLVSKY